MAFTTADMRLFDVLFRFLAVSGNLNLVRKKGERPFELRTELHMLA